jgi:HD superfamily phosphodiesterase
VQTQGEGLAFGDPVYAAIYQRARPHLQTRHNEAHTEVSYGFALRLLAEEEGDPAVVIPAILLHDVGWSKVPEDRQLAAFGPNVQEPELTRVHEREGAAMAAGILREIGYPEVESRAIVEIIAGHDTRLTALSPSDAVVKDADKLFRLSALGFPIDCARFGLRPESHLAWLQERIDRWFFTETGRRLARDEIAARARELGVDGLGGAGDRAVARKVAP